MADNLIGTEISQSDDGSAFRKITTTTPAEDARSIDIALMAFALSSTSAGIAGGIQQERSLNRAE